MSITTAPDVPVIGVFGANQAAPSALLAAELLGAAIVEAGAVLLTAPTHPRAATRRARRT